MVITTSFATWFGAETVMGIPAKFATGGMREVVEDPFGASMCLVLVGLFFAQKTLQDEPADDRTTIEIVTANRSKSCARS